MLKQKLKQKIKDIVLENGSKLVNDMISSNENKGQSSQVVEPEVVDNRYENDEQFEAGIKKSLSKTGAKFTKGNPKEIINAFSDLIKLVGEVQKFEEVQITKRTEINAKRDIIVKQIETEKEYILTYLNKSFDERENNFKKLFSILDDAVAKNNMQQLALTLDSITELATSSPFKDLTDIGKIRENLKKKIEWDI